LHPFERLIGTIVIVIHVIEIHEIETHGIGTRVTAITATDNGTVTTMIQSTNVNAWGDRKSKIPTLSIKAL
jgi:hypothetical protein